MNTPIKVRFNPISGAIMSDTEAADYKQDISTWQLASITQLEALVDECGTDQAFCGPIECIEGIYEFDWDKQIYEGGQSNDY